MQPTTSTTHASMGVAPSGAHTSAVAWSAVLAGAFAAASLSLILLILGAGLGLISVSPWAHTGPSTVTLTSAIIIWLIIMQWLSSGLGGYLAGRLRTKYISLHTDEVFFRDTAHGFLAWAVASVVIAALSVSAISSGIDSMLALSAPKPSIEKSMSGPAEANMYVVDTLFRSAHPSPGNDDRVIRGETTRILMTGLKNGEVSQTDRTYLAALVVAHANITQAEAAKRVGDTIEQIKTTEIKAKEVADTARKTGAMFSIFTFLSMLIGAFIASVAGALGGKQRDEY